MRSYLETEDLWSVEGAPSSFESKSDLFQWEEKDQLAVASIKLHLSAMVLVHVGSCTTGAELWDKLDEMYNRKKPIAQIRLFQELMHFKIRADDDCRQKLDDFHTIIDKIRLSGWKIPEKIYSSMLLCSLPNEFSSIPGSLPLLGVLRTKIRSQELLIQLMDGRQ